MLTPWRDQAAALIEAWYPGQQAGAALARVLFGDTDPGGRLPMTFPKREGDLPTAGNINQYPGLLQVFYSEGPLVGYRWYDAEGVEPAFPFGHGLSYTTFGYGGLEIHDIGSRRSSRTSASGGAARSRSCMFPFLHRSRGLCSRHGS